ncbi:MAG: quinone-dependent dihydroorotate dehydrogenase [Bacteroidia bacterium]|nr:quinone-dependent dihydroorotate dehydrogenase [Bacteroidia bacterium]
MYKQFLRPLLFNLSAEDAHHFSFSSLKNYLMLPGGGAILNAMFQAPQGLEKELFGLKFKNPVGLAAGFDKDAILAENWKYLGFGFVELGTVTPKPQEGNPKPRLFRLPKDKAVINRMGFNNQGVDALERRLQKMNKGDLIVGANIGKNKVTPNEEAVEDYKICFSRLFDYVDYFVVNVSSPNTPGLRSLQEKEPLTKILNELQEINHSKSKPKPLLLKIAPDLENEQLDDVVEVSQDTKLSGLIATNTTISRSGLTTHGEEVSAMGNGGLSGKPLTERATEVVSYLRSALGDDFPLIGVGGIMNGEDAKQRMKAGADLIQVYTGFIYEGPAFAKQLVEALKRG